MAEFVFLNSSGDFNEIIFNPIRNYSRINYTCFDVSAKFIVFGSSSGAVYLFERLDRNAIKYLSTLTNNEGQITSVSFSPDDDHLLAVGTNKGTLIIIEIILPVGQQLDTAWKCLYLSKTFTSSSITILKWDQYSEYKLFICDEAGLIYMLFRVKSLTNLLVAPNPAPILKLDSKVNQFDVSEELVIVSTLYRTILHDTLDGSISQIGKKSRPAGEYGISFFPREIDEKRIYKCIYSARPGSRIWESDLKGDVHYTHQFKQTLSMTKTSAVITPTEPESPPLPENSVPKSPTFAKFYVIEFCGRYFLLTHTKEPFSSIYMLNPQNASVAAQASFQENIKQIVCFENDIFILHESDKQENSINHKFTQLTFLNLDLCFVEMVRLNKTSSAVRLLINHEDYFKIILGDENSVVRHLLTSHPDCVSADNLNLLKDIFKSFDIDLNEIGISKQFKIDLDNHSHNHSTTHSQSTDGEENQNNVFNAKTMLNITDYEVAKLNSQKLELLEFENNCSKMTESELFETSINYLTDKLIKDEIISQKCDCGFPKPFVQENLTDSQKNLKDKLKEGLKKGFLSVENAIKISKDSALWSLYLELLSNSENLELYFDVNLIMGNLDRISLDVAADKNYDIFLLLVERYLRLRLNCPLTSINCPSCLKVHQNVSKITWEEITRFLVRKCGGKMAINILKTFETEISVNELSIDSYLSIVRSELLSSYQSSITKTRLNRLNAFVDVPKTKSELSWCRTVSIQDKKCAHCSILIKPQETLVIFKCQHIFHSKCCTDRTCCHSCKNL